jgi:thioredoxin 1
MKAIEISDKNFDTEVIKSEIPVMVDFWAPWCGPCRLIAPIIEELADEFKGKVKFAKINVDENPVKAGQYQILSIPNMKIFKSGQVFDEIIGAASKENIKSVLVKAF